MFGRDVSSEMLTTPAAFEALRQAVKERFDLLTILGPTASGKTGLAVSLARLLGAEIISADSRQIYRGMDLGTGKDLSEYRRNGEAVPYHLIDILDPKEEFSVFAYQERVYHCLREIAKRRRLPLLVGGTGLYLDAILSGYRMLAVPRNSSLREFLEDEDMESLRRRYFSLSPNVHNTTDILDRSRLVRAIEIAEFNCEHCLEKPPQVLLSYLVIGIRCKRDVLRRRITARLTYRIECGMIDEVRRLHETGIEWGRIESFGLEYRYIARHLQGKSSFREMFENLNTCIHQFAKRQDTWFRRMERKGVKIHWIEEADERSAISLIEGLLS